jgi:two-component system NtrC family sensor kinase
LVEGVFAFVNVRSQERQVVDRMVRGVDQLSRAITSATWHAMLADQRAAAYEIMQTIAREQGIDRIRIFNKEGRVMFSTGPERGSMVNKRAEACFMCHAAEQPLVRVDVPSRARVFRGADGRRELGMITPIYNEPSCSQAACHAHARDRSVLGVLDVTLDLAPVDRELSAFNVRMLLMFGLEIVLVGLFIVFFTQHFVERPIRKLIAGAQAVSDMRLDTPVEIRSSEELEALARSFEAMRVRLKQALDGLNEFNQRLESMVQERTEQLRTAEHRLAQSDRLASLGQLAASMAHEINNPVSGILNLSMLMQRILGETGVPPERLAEFRSHLAQVTTQTTRVGRIVSDLLAFSRRSRPQYGPADLTVVVRDTVALVRHKLELSQVKLDLDLQHGLPPVHCDASQLQQALTNLLLNAAQSIEGAGRVRVATVVSRENGMAMIEIEDSGSGISPEDLPRIFDPFFTTKEPGKGLGLGLAVAYGIVKAHGGDIEVESHIGRGSTFRVLLPLQSEDASPPAGGAGRRA